jgi:hypothetical protein
MPISHALVRGVAVRGGRMNHHTASTENAISEIQSCVVALHGNLRPNDTPTSTAMNNAADQRVAVSVVIFIPRDSDHQTDLSRRGTSVTRTAMALRANGYGRKRLKIIRWYPPASRDWAIP